MSPAEAARAESLFELKLGIEFILYISLKIPEENKNNYQSFQDKIAGKVPILFLGDKPSALTFVLNP